MTPLEYQNSHKHSIDKYGFQLQKSFARVLMTKKKKLQKFKGE